jgi:hypothetical protein
MKFAKIILLFSLLSLPALGQDEQLPSAPEASSDGDGSATDEQQATPPATTEAPAAQDTPAPADEIVPLSDVVDATGALVKDAKGMGKLGLAIAVLNLLIMFLKTQLAGAWFAKRGPKTKRLLLVVFGQAAGILLAIEGGLSPLSAVIGGLITSGGAMLVYEAAKPFLKKKPA